MTKAFSRELETGSPQADETRDKAFSGEVEAGSPQNTRQTQEGSGNAMVQVSVTINGRQFRMACEEGEEPHLMRLAEDLDQRIGKLRARFGEIGDTRLTVMAALTLADELSETKEKLQRFEPEMASLQDARVQSAERAKATQAAVAAALNSAAERIEGMTRRLNETLRDDKVAIG